MIAIAQKASTRELLLSCLIAKAMWNLDTNRHVAHWTSDAASRWGASGGSKSPFWLGETDPNSSANPLRLNLESTDGRGLPPVAESFVRGSQWHLSMPEDVGWAESAGVDPFSLSMVIRVVESSAQRWVAELTLAIQTSRLDTHPNLDLHCPGQTDRAESSIDGEPAVVTKTVRSPDSGQIAVLLDHHDAPFTSHCSGDHECRLRFFGEFLEKGVIRKARPWLVFSTSANPLTPSDLDELLRRQAATPLPLTA